MGVPLRASLLIGTARIRSAAQTAGCVEPENPESLSNVQSADVLVSHSTPVREHEISIVPGAPHASSSTHDAAVSDGRSEAHAIGVDAWLTEDQTHVVTIAPIARRKVRQLVGQPYGSPPNGTVQRSTGSGPTVAYRNPGSAASQQSSDPSNM